MEWRANAKQGQGWPGGFWGKGSGQGRLCCSKGNWGTWVCGRGVLRRVYFRRGQLGREELLLATLGHVAHGYYIFGARECWGWFWRYCDCSSYSNTTYTLKTTVLLALRLLTDSMQNHLRLGEQLKTWLLNRPAGWARLFRKVSTCTSALVPVVCCGVHSSAGVFRPELLRASQTAGRTLGFAQPGPVKQVFI